MEKASSLPCPPPLEGLLQEGDVSLFLDFDGTLVGIAAEPGAIDVPDKLPAALHSLRDRLGGRLALITGRALDDLQSHLGEVSVCRAGSHGASRLLPDGSRLGDEPSALTDDCVSEMRSYADLHGLYYETKAHGGALHFRAQPDRKDEALKFAHGLAERYGLEVTSGKGVAELVRPGANKGGAVHAFMQEKPFAGSLPIFIGDDTTDEDGMQAAIECGGFGIAVGERKSEAARYHLENVAAVHNWLNI